MLFEREGDMGYIDHKTDLFADARKKLDQFTKVSKKVETHDGMFFANHRRRVRTHIRCGVDS
jgi:hypothetical protein